jgi:long-chain acyl-CoA synthetase
LTIVEGIEKLIVDPETLKPVETGTHGELIMRGPEVFPGYISNEKANQKSFIYPVDAGSEASSGKLWFRTGDRASIDKDGLINVYGRLGDDINKLGFLLVVEHIESSVRDNLDWVDACVVVRADHIHHGEDAVAVIRPQKDATIPQDWQKEVKLAVRNNLDDLHEPFMAYLLQDLGLEQ